MQAATARGMKRYLITDPAYYHDTESFQAYLKHVFAHRPDFAAFRDKRSENSLPYAALFAKYAAEAGCRMTLLNGNVALARELGYGGVHLTSAQHAEIAHAKAAGLFTVISTHSTDEALAAGEAGADAVTISPIFHSPGKGEPKGIDYLRRFCKRLDGLMIFALGGIVSDREVAALEGTGVDGFASIRYFV